MRGNHFQTVETSIVVGERGYKPRLLQLHLLENILHYPAHFVDSLGDLRLAVGDPLVVVLVHLVDELGLGRHHLRWHEHGVCVLSLREEHRTPAAVYARARHAVLCRLSHVRLPDCEGRSTPTGMRTNE